MKEKVLLIDGNSLFYRAYYGSAYAPRGILKTSKGTPVNAVLTFNNMLKKYITRVSPSKIIVAFDAGKKTFRHNELESYKAGRSSPPDEMKPQWPIVKEMLDSMKIPHIAIPNYEADDIIGSFSTYDNYTFVVLSSDKDMYQLVNDNVEILVPQNGQKPDVSITSSNFNEVTGIFPDQVTDYKGMVGDTSDNLPGIKGIGDKTAVKLLSKYGSLEAIYENLDDLPEKQKQKFLNDEKSAFLCKRIATIKCDMDLDSISSFNSEHDVVSPDEISFYEKYELNSLIKRYSGQVQTKRFDKLIF